MAAARPANVAGSDVVHSAGSPALKTFGPGRYVLRMLSGPFDGELGIEAKGFLQVGLRFRGLAQRRVGRGQIRISPKAATACVERLLVFVDRGFGKLDERLTPKPSSSRVSSQWKSPSHFSRKSTRWTNGGATRLRDGLQGPRTSRRPLRYRALNPIRRRANQVTRANGA